MKQYTLINRVLAGVSFLLTLITYTLTLQPSVPFWDCGEFSAATAWQQVPHPPGAPLFLIVGRWFNLIPFGDPGWRINMFSAFSSAVTAALVYLIIVKLIERWRPYRAGSSIMNYLPTLGGALIGTLAFTWSDTQWFNSVESEVYAPGTLLIALMVWVMMRWNEQAERPGHERYLLLIAYLTGLAFGVHLLALLVIPAAAMVIYFRRYQFNPLSFMAMLGITALAFYYFAYKAPLQYIPQMVASQPALAVMLVLGLMGLVWWGISKEPQKPLLYISAALLLPAAFWLFSISPYAALILIGTVGALIWWGVAATNPKPIVYLSAASMLLIILGFTTYTHILLRSNAHPAMNENEPDTVSELVSYLGREQYGYAPNWPRRYQTDGYYRRYQDEYGDWSPPTRQSEDGKPIFDNTSLGGELNFMIRYQIYQMYIRYFLWNFVGRVSDEQDAPATLTGASEETHARYIAPTGYDDVFPIQFFALPLLLGLVGFYYHARRDWKMALVYLTLFLLLGVIATLQQNQQQPQPRERDYFYVGSYMIFAMWIGIGACGLAEKFGLVKRDDDEAVVDREVNPESGSVVTSYRVEAKPGVMIAVLAAAFLVAPVNMVMSGWKFHDRSKNWVPWDYAYNILQSCEQDAILFCNGDNDTFPLWYIQDVAAVRRDVRVVNLSLGQTSWYIWQLKNERPWGAKTVPISIPDNTLRLPETDDGSLRPELVRTLPTVKIPVPADVMSKATNGASTQAGEMSWPMRLDPYGQQQGYIMGVQHKLVRDILITNKWQRPVYFSTSTGGDVHSGLEPFFRQEGMAWRIMPVQQGSPRSPEAVNAEIMRKCLMGTLPDDQSFKTPHYGFKFRNLTDRNAFFMNDHRRLMLNYRSIYMTLASHELIVAKDKAAAIATLDKLEQVISPDMFAMPYPIAANIADIYGRAGAREKAAKYANRVIAALDAMGDEANNPKINEYAEQYPPLPIKSQMYMAMGDYDKAVEVYEPIRRQYPNEPSVRAQMESMRFEKFLAKNDTAGAIVELEKIITEYGSDSGGGLQQNVSAFRARLAELRNQPDNTAVGDTSGRNKKGVGAD